MEKSNRFRFAFWMFVILMSGFTTSISGSALVIKSEHWKSFGLLAGSWLLTFLVIKWLLFNFDKIFGFIKSSWLHQRRANVAGSGYISLKFVFMLVLFGGIIATGYWYGPTGTSFVLGATHLEAIALGSFSLMVFSIKMAYGYHTPRVNRDNAQVVESKMLRDATV